MRAVGRGHGGTEVRAQQRARVEKEVAERAKYLQKSDFGYLDVFEQEQKERKQAQSEFNKQEYER